MVAKTGANFELQSAYVLHGRPYRDTSALVEIFSHQHGRLGLVARGVRTGKSKLSGILQPFTPLLISWYGRGELLTLKQAEAAGLPFQLQGSSLMSGFYLNELIMRLLQRADPHPQLFESYCEALAAIAENETRGDELRNFEKSLLHELGYGLVLDHDVQTGKAIDADQDYLYRLDSGPRLHNGKSRDGLILKGRTLQAIDQGAYPDEQSRHEAKRLMRAALGLHLGDRPLRTRELYNRLKIKD